jgi:hypothetical protein
MCSPTSRSFWRKVRLQARVPDHLAAIRDALVARLVGGLTIETLRKQAMAGDDPDRTASP